MEFVLVILNTLACFIAGFFLFKPKVRRMFPTAPIVAVLYLEGLWAMVNYIISGIWPDNHVMDIINSCIFLIASVSIIYAVYTFTKRVERQRKNARHNVRTEENDQEQDY